MSTTNSAQDSRRSPENASQGALSADQLRTAADMLRLLNTPVSRSGSRSDHNGALDRARAQESAVNNLVVTIDNPSDELRMLLDDFLSDETDAQCDGWEYTQQPEREMDVANVREHTERRLDRSSDYSYGALVDTLDDCLRMLASEQPPRAIGLEISDSLLTAEQALRKARRLAVDLELPDDIFSINRVDAEVIRRHQQTGRE